MTNLPTRLSEHLSLSRLPLCVLKSQELLVLGAGIVAPESQPAEPPRCANPSSLDGSDQLTDLKGSILHADKGSIFNAV